MYYKVFIDTNIYDGANYSFQNAAFTALRNRAKNGELELHINYVIEGETREHINKRVKGAAKKLLNSVKQQELAGFKNIPGFKDLLQIPVPKEWVDKAIQEFNSLLTDCNIKRIPVNGVDVELIISDYFNKRLPFEEKKPEEFKDAIAIASIILEAKNISDDEVYVVISNDIGFKKAIKEKALNPNNIIEYDSLNSFIELLALTDDLATHLKKFFDEGGAADDIVEAVKEAIKDARIEIERQDFVCIDEYDVVDIDDIEYEVSILNIEDGIASIAVSATCTVKVWYKFTDMENSYWDKEEHCYLWQTIAEIEDTYSTGIDLELSFNIANWIPTVEEKQEVLFEEYLEMPATIVMEEDCLIDTEDLTEHESEEEPLEDSYDTCPDRGKRISFENDGGNGFCVDCAPNH